MNLDRFNKAFVFVTPHDKVLQCQRAWLVTQCQSTQRMAVCGTMKSGMKDSCT